MHTASEGSQATVIGGTADESPRIKAASSAEAVLPEAVASETSAEAPHAALAEARALDVTACKAPTPPGPNTVPERSAQGSSSRATRQAKDRPQVQYIGVITQRSMAKKGRLNWPEGAWLDRLDKGWSDRLFHLDLSLKLEICLSAPAMWFGIAAYTTSVIPVTFVATAPETSWRFAIMICCPWLALMVGWWPARCMRSALGGNGVAKKLLEFKPGVCFAGPHIVMAAAWYACTPSMGVLALYFCSFYATSVLVEVLCGLVWRTRPLATKIAAALKRFDRALPDAALVMHTDTLVNLSFPSGTAASVAVWGTTTLVAGPGWPVACLALPAMLAAAYGNVYFRIHYVLDVLAGELLGVAVTLLLSRCGSIHWGFVLAAQLVQTAALEQIHQRFWPQEPLGPRQQTLQAMQLLKEKLG